MFYELTDHLRAGGQPNVRVAVRQPGSAQYRLTARPPVKPAPAQSGTR